AQQREDPERVRARQPPDDERDDHGAAADRAHASPGHSPSILDLVAFPSSHPIHGADSISVSEDFIEPIRILARMDQGSRGRLVSGVIVHYKTPEDPVAAVRAVEETAPAAEIVVVDNASGDRVAEELERRIPGARLIRESVNRGYGAACNRGARGSSRPF